jgi:hypothetical protein
VLLSLLLSTAHPVLAHVGKITLVIVTEQRSTWVLSRAAIATLRGWRFTRMASWPAIKASRGRRLAVQPEELAMVVRWVLWHGAR